MLKIVCAVYDVKTGTYDRPILFTTQGEAIRSFSDVANDDKTVIGQHPEDFRIDHIADFNLQTGEFVQVSKPKPLIEAAQLVKPKQ